MELDADLALLVGEGLLLQVDGCCLAFAGRSCRAQGEKRSIRGWMPCFRILDGQVPSSQVLRLLQHPPRRIFLYVPPHARQIDLPLRLLCPRRVRPCADKQLLHADPVSGHALPFEGLDLARGEAAHVRACGTHLVDHARLCESLAQAQYWPSRSRLYGCRPSL